jgi:hypothetical protein
MVRRLLLLPAGFAVIVAVAFAANPAWARSAGLDVWNASALAREHQAALEYQRELEDMDKDICRRIGAKEMVVGDVIAGRTTLAGATARFMTLNEQPEYLKMIRETYSGSSDEEKMARNVIHYCVGRVKNPVACEQLRRRLGAELQALVHAQAAAY